MKVKWSIDLLLDAERTVEIEVARRAALGNKKQILDYCLQRVQKISDSDDPMEDALKVYFAIAGLKIASFQPSQSAPIVLKLEKVVKGLLFRNKVKPRKSHLAHVYAQLAEALSLYYREQGQLNQALWETSMGFTLSQGAKGYSNCLQKLSFANLLLDKGSVSSAAQIYRELIEETNDPSIRSHVAINLVKAVRLSGRVDLSIQLFKGIKVQDLQPELTDDLIWEQFALQGLKFGLAEVKSSIKHIDPIHADPSILIKYSLWMKSERSQEQKERAFRVSWIRRQSKHPLTKELATKAALKVLETIENCYKTDLSYETRLKGASLVLNLSEKLDIETRILSLMALLRWTIRNNQKQLLLALIEEYRSLCLRLSDGSSSDIFKFFGEEPDVFAVFDHSNLATPHTPSFIESLQLAEDASEQSPGFAREKKSINFL